MEVQNFANNVIEYPQDFNYNINHPSLCLQYTEVFLLVAIRTIFAHYDRRMAIRETWGSKHTYKGLHIPLVFMFGAMGNKDIQNSIERENKIYKDIIQEDFMDSDNNLTLKTAMSYKWASKHCPHASYVMVANDNIIVDIFKLIPYLKSQSPSADKFTVCNFQKCCEAPPQSRFLKSNYFKYYGRSEQVCSSDAYLAPIGVVDKLFQASLSTPRFGPDQAWMGVVAREAGITFQNTASAFVGIDDKTPVLKKFMGVDYLTSPAMIGVVKDEFLGKEATIMRHLWRIIQEHHTRMQLSSVYHAQFPSKSSDSSSVLVLAVSLMFVDLLVVVIIFLLIFCKKKHRRKVLH
ncbi:beta-1,3-galactosyltransferase 1-like [Haliotis asinina]|uniref:beta-1,3-galactosyltransferase 1-like n=1 Tax=Haliotis asinina TaxID=109174 RepID=UPI00353206BA